MTLTPRIAALLTVPPMLWAGNTLLGRLLAPVMPPLLLNCLRWWLALAILLPLGWRAIGTPERRAEIRARWRPLAGLGLLGVGAYNALQYLALHTSTPINVTLIASSIPLWMMLVGALFYRERPRGGQLAGAVLSLAGVMVVLLRGDLSSLGTIRLVAGDLWILVAALAWAGYSWQLARPAASMRGEQRPDWNWAEFLLVQVIFGVGWATLSAVGEAIWMPQPVQWSPMAVAALVFIAVGPSVLAFRLWGRGVAEVGPAIAGFFANLTPLFTALLSAALLGEPPHPYHALAFALIVGGIVASNRR
ncbi:MULTISPECIES: DMT family transporter [Rubrivivax]|uniref:DMT family transporter n=1 Tax=Rubrivivax benzoatilyticus TaxID=316997 RepID=A0ABX0HQZ5_9BURK|nr:MULTISPECIES: DMT family transporter [Rubrivivax]MCC9595892.1 DMT family transporter [Rubrivivax sp. JA1055]MCC9647767.1 DMT family transporter [Rubrivivax sp. JA1029]NHK97491.1 DMT family transporter [Rubrivivax benzoatilyticus]NHL22814.1 DMT family transporter [Rubrivivax benzoatilyticus]